MELLIFFALPIATIIISAILTKIIKSPVAVAALIFAIYLIVTFAVFDEGFLIATLAYTIIAFITALIVSLLSRNEDDENNGCGCSNNILSNLNDTNNNNSSCGCSRFNRFKRF